MFYSLVLAITSSRHTRAGLAPILAKSLIGTQIDPREIPSRGLVGKQSGKTARRKARRALSPDLRKAARKRDKAARLELQRIAAVERAARNRAKYAPKPKNATADKKQKKSKAA